MWGKSCANRRDTSIINIPYEQSLDKFINTNADYIVRGINREFVLMKPYTFQYSYPQFGCCIISNAAAFMSKIIYRAMDLGIELFYTNTDCLSMYAQDLKILDRDMYLIGNDLGEFSYEVANGTKFIGISPMTTYFKFSGNKDCVRLNHFVTNKVFDMEEYFEERYRTEE
jgi:hypothetical protein